MGSFHSPRISWLQSVAMILITVIGTLLILGSGGGGGGGTTGGSDSGSEDGGGSFPAAIESAALDRETGQHPKSINVNSQLNHLRNGPFVSAISHIDESHEATRIVLTERTIVRRLRWSGIHFNGVEYGITGGKKLFNIRVFRDVMGLPADQAFIDIFVNAEVEDLGTIDGVDKKYKFSIINNDLFTLSSGSYWVAILDASENLSRFSWSVEQDSETTLYGNGGAFRDTEDDDWIASSAPQVTDATQSRGRSLAVYGEPTSLTNPARGIHYFTGYS
ncbi:MAG: hypothetical protein DRQ59_14770, partial [Gammaproteobacteria bacterium]